MSVINNRWGELERFVTVFAKWATAQSFFIYYNAILLFFSGYFEGSRILSCILYYWLKLSAEDL